MESPPGPRKVLRFGAFELDRDAQQLRKGGVLLRLQPQPFKMLAVLAARAGQVVTREEVRYELWGNETFVDFEQGLNYCMRQIRTALGDEAQTPRYVETVPRRGYRFIAPVDGLEEERREEPKAKAESAGRKSQRLWIMLGAGALLLVFVGATGYVMRERARRRLTASDTIVVADFANSTGDSVFDDTLKTALNVALGQSPFLNVLSPNKVEAALRRMTRAEGTKLTPDVAREVCQRAGSKAYIAGSIARLGNQYVVTVEAVNCETGDTLAEEQGAASSKEKVLDALGAATSKLRRKLGESLATVQKYDVALREATTPSLEALKADSLGEKFLYRGDSASAPPYFERALELDPNFAMADMQLGIAYLTMNEPGRARGYFAKAFALREQTSGRERLQIEAAYYGDVTGELDKAIQALQEVVEVYKHSSSYNGLAFLYARTGQYEKSAEAARMLLALDADRNFGYLNLVSDEMALGNFSEARKTMAQAQGHGLDSAGLHTWLYMFFFLQRDAVGMAEQDKWFAGRRNDENYGLELRANSEAYAGHASKARELTRSAADSAVRAKNKESAAQYEANEALQDAAFGNAAMAERAAAEALRLAPGAPDIAVQAALAFAMVGKSGEAETLVRDLNKNFPLDTQMQLLGVPAIEAELQLARRQPEAAVNTLRGGLTIEFANTSFSTMNISCLYPTYIRGEAYLAAGQGRAAAREFQKIIEHNGIVGNCWTGALARLEAGRAHALVAKKAQGADAEEARGRERAAYEDFLKLWKDADPQIAVLKEATAEYGKLGDSRH